MSSGYIGTAPATRDPEVSNDSVGTSKIQDDAVTAVKIAAGAVGASEIAADAVGSSEIAADAVGASEIAADAVGASELADDAVDTAAIADNAVTIAKIAVNAVGASELANDAVDTAAIADNAVTGAKIAMGSDATGDIIKYNGTDYARLARGTSEQVLRVNTAGTDLEFADAVGGAAWALKTAAYTAVAGDGVMVDTSSSAITITLPISSGPPSLGDFVRVLDATGNAATNNITVARNGNNIQGATADLTISTNRAAIGLVYVNATQGWVLIEN